MNKLKFFLTVFSVLFLFRADISAQVDEVIEVISSPSEQSFYPQADNSQTEAANNQGIRTKRRFANPPLLSKGWRTFCGLGFQKAEDKYSCDVMDLSIKLGWQFSPYFFAGIGLDEQIYIDHWYLGSYKEEAEYAIVLPLYVVFRSDLLNKKVTPFIDFRAGYAATDDEYNNYSGFYFSPSAGLRIGKVSVAFGAEYLRFNRTRYFIEFTSRNVKTVNRNFQVSYLIKISYDFGGNF